MRDEYAEAATFLFFLSVALGLTCLFLYKTTVWSDDVIGQKEFIYEHATYQCTKTNELKEGK